MDFAPFDTRGYPVLPVELGYTEWAPTYDATVHDELDLDLLARVSSVPWSKVLSAVDLACGTGRIGAWLKRRGVGAVEGVDTSTAMLDRARDKSVYDALHRADIRATGLTAGAFQLATCILAECHLEDLQTLYTETARLLAAGGVFVLVGYHPHFLFKGIPTHFDRADGTSAAVANHIHLLSDHAKAALAMGFELLEIDERVFDDDWIAKRPRFACYRDEPVSFCLAWRKRD